MAFGKIGAGFGKLGAPLGGARISYDQSALAVFAAMTTPPTTARKALINTAILALKAQGIWALLDSLQVYAAADSQAASVDWIVPTRIATLVNSPAFATDRGFTSDGSTSYVDTGFLPTGLANYTVNSASSSIWSLTAAAIASENIMGATSGGIRVVLFQLYDGTNLTTDINNSGTSFTSPNTDGSGFYTQVRSAAAVAAVYRNGVALALSVGTNATAIPNGGNFTVGKAGSRFSTRQASMFSAGGALTASQASKFYVIMQSYMDSVVAGFIGTLARIKAAAAGAVSNNPVDLTDMASPPTVTLSNTHDSSLSVQANHLSNPSAFLVSSGNAYDTATNQLFVGTQNVSPTIGNLQYAGTVTPPLVDTGDAQVCYTISFDTSAPTVEIQIVPNYGTITNVFNRLIVNKQFVARDGFLVNNSYAKMAFGSPALRTITMEVENLNGEFVGVSVGSGYTITAPTGAVVKGVFTGDSITESYYSGETNFYVFDGWASTFSKQMGVNSMRNAAVASTGYVADHSGLNSNIYGQMAHWIDGDKYDIIGFAGGYNDVFLSQAPVNAMQCLRLARARQPQALIILFGVFPEATGPSAGVLALEAALQSAFNSWADPLSLFIPIATDSGGSWLTGTGYVGNTTGGGNSDTYVSSDGKHLSRVGRIYIGGKANAAIRAALPALYSAFGIS